MIGLHHGHTSIVEICDEPDHIFHIDEVCRLHGNRTLFENPGEIRKGIASSNGGISQELAYLFPDGEIKK